MPTKWVAMCLLAWGGETPPPDLPRVDHTPSHRTSRPETSATVKADRTIKDEMVIEDSGQVQIITTEPPVPRRSRALPSARGSSNKKMIAAIAGAAALLVAILAFAMRSGSSSTPSTEPTTPPIAHTPPVTAPVTPAPARLEVVVSPPEAVLSMDGKVLGSNPYVGSFDRDMQVHELVVSADGYQPLTQRFALDRDLNFHLSLQRRPEPTIPVATATTTPPPTTTQTQTQTRTREVATKRPTTTRPTTTRPTRDRTPPSLVTTPAVTAPPVETTPAVTTSPTTAAKAPATDGKHSLDGDLYDNKNTKRSLDTNVLDDKNKPKPKLDRDNPWKN